MPTTNTTPARRQGNAAFWRGPSGHAGGQTTFARQLGAAGHPDEAFALARAVVDDATREVGPDDHLTLNARFEAAVWAQEVEGTAAGIRAFGELLDDLYVLSNASLALVEDVQWNLSGALIDAARLVL